MPDLINNSWTIARSAILTHQHRLAVTANNIANVDTPGYARRDVHLATVQETPSSRDEVRHYSNGVGVRVADVVRAQSAMIQNLLRGQTGDTEGHNTRANALGQLESLLREDGSNSLDARLNAFWNSWHDLANQADNVAFRTVVAQRSHDLSAHIQSLYGRIQSFESTIISGAPGAFGGQLPADVNRFNQLTSQLQELNARISYSLGGFSPNGLMDQRDMVVRELSGLADITVGSDFEVTLGGQQVVSANGSNRAELSVTDGGPPPVFDVAGVPVVIARGTLGAWGDVLDIAAGMRDRLDTLAMDLMAAVNDIHNSDRNLDGDSYDLFGDRCDWDFFTGTGAADMAVNSYIYDPANPLAMDPHRIAAAASRHDAGPPPVPNTGDGQRALEIAQLADSARAALNGQTFAGFHVTGAAMLGSLVQSERALADDGESIISALEDALQSEVGVNLDEELMDMMMAQRAFQAAARLLQTIDEMILTILQR